MKNNIIAILLAIVIAAVSVTITVTLTTLRKQVIQINKPESARAQQEAYYRSCLNTINNIIIAEHDKESLANLIEYRKELRSKLDNL